MFGLPFLAIAVHGPGQSEASLGSVRRVLSPAGQAVGLVDGGATPLGLERPGMRLDGLPGSVGPRPTRAYVAGLLLDLLNVTQVERVHHVTPLQHCLSTVLQVGPLGFRLEGAQGGFSFSQALAQTGSVSLSVGFTLENQTPLCPDHVPMRVGGVPSTLYLDFKALADRRC